MGIPQTEYGRYSGHHEAEAVAASVEEQGVGAEEPG